MEALRIAYLEGKPYFGEIYEANQLCPIVASHFPCVIDAVRKSTGRHVVKILEVGSWAGQSLVAWDDAAGHECELTCIDHWRPYSYGFGITDYIVERAAEIKKLFEHNMRACGLLPRLRVLEGSSEDRLNELRGELFDVVFIDGDHRYDAVSKDIELAKVLVGVGGVLCGDDLDRQYLDVIDKEACREANRKGLDNIEDSDRQGYHPGVTQAVHEAFGAVECSGRMWKKFF